MTRTMTEDVADALASSHVRWALMFEAFFDSGTLRMWTGLGVLEYGGNDFQGGGDFIGFSGAAESSDLRNDATQIQLSGVPSELVSVALSEDYQGRRIEIKFIVFGPDGSVLTDPISVFVGFADQMTISDDQSQATISLSVENEIARFERASNRRYSTAGLQEQFAGDRGLDFMPLLASKDIVWGGGKSTGKGGGSTSTEGRDSGDVGI